MSQVNSTAILIVLVSLFSISTTVLHPPALSTISDLITGGARGKALGFFGSAGTLGIALGPITLSLLIGTIGWRSVYLIWGITTLLVPVLILRLKIEKTGSIETVKPQHGTSSEFAILANLSLVLILAIMGARAMGGTAINTYITPYFVDMLKVEPATAMFIFGASPLIGVLASSMGGFMVDRVGEKKWFALGLVSQIACLLAVALSTSLELSILGYLSYAFFATMEMPAEQSLITKITPRSGRGLAFAVSFLPGTIAGALSPILVHFWLNRRDLADVPLRARNVFDCDIGVGSPLEKGLGTPHLVTWICV